jgi:MAE_28990/MAE_18760-like HEPN
MSLRSAAQLEIHLDRALAWRKKELTSLKFVVTSAAAAAQPVLLRAALGLLYAHWEGYIKDSASAYVRHAADQALPLRNLTPNFLTMALQGKIRRLRDAERLVAQLPFVELLRGGLADIAKIQWSQVVKTRANLKSVVFREIVVSLGLDFTPFALKAKPVIDVLVDKRNSIVHGRGSPVTETEYDVLHSGVIEMLDEFTRQLELAADKKGYAA